MKFEPILRVVLTLSMLFLALTGSQAAPRIAYAQDDIAGVVVTPTSSLITSEGGQTAQFSVVLTMQPLAGTTVSITLASSNTDEGRPSPNSLTFTDTNWDAPQDVTVIGQDDLVDDGNIAYTIIVQPAVSDDIAFNGIDPDDVQVTNLDNDTAGFTVAPSSGLITSEAGGTDTFSVRLTSSPTAPVNVSLTSSNPSEGRPSPTSLVFNASNWNNPQAVTVTGQDDFVDDGSVAYTVVLQPAVSDDTAYSGLNPNDVQVTNLDNDTAGYTVNPSSGLQTSESGSTDTFTVRLTSSPTAPVYLSLTSSDLTEGTVTPGLFTFTDSNWSVTQQATVTGQNDALLDGDQSFQIQFSATTADTLFQSAPGPVSVINLDDEVVEITTSPDSYSVRQDNTLTVSTPGVLGNDWTNFGSLSAELVTGAANGTVTLNANGSFVYVPATGFFGPDSFTYIARNGTYASGATTVSINVEMQIVVNTQSDSYEIDQDETLTISAPGVLANDSTNSGSLTAELLSAPTNGSVTLNQDGGFTYVPNPAYSGPDTFTYRARNGDVVSGTTSVNITVNLVVVVFAQNETYITDEDTPLTVSAPGVLANDSTNGPDPLTAELVAQPTNGSVTLAANGSFTYTPNLDFFGSDSFTYRARSGAVLSADATVNITVNQVFWINAVNDSYQTRINQEINQPAAGGVLSNDTTNAPRVQLRARLINGPAHAESFTFQDTGSFVYTPVHNYVGPDSFTYQAFLNNGNATSIVATVNLSILDTHATNDTYATNENTTLDVTASAGVLANDGLDQGFPRTVQLVTPTTNGTLTLQPTGAFTYIPFHNYSGPDSFTYRFRTGLLGQFLSNTATVTINVILTNQPPSSANDSYITNAVTNTNNPTLSRAFNVQAPGLLANDIDPDGGALTVISPAPGTAHTTTQGGSVVVNPSGSFTYTPAPGFEGTDTFVYSVTDVGGKVATATASILVDITPPPAPTWTSHTPGSTTTIRDETIELEVNIDPALTDFDRVAFYRYDPMTLSLQPLGSASTSPYSITVDTDLLNFKYNQINAYVFDRAGNFSQMTYIWLLREYPIVGFFPIVGR